MDAMDAETYMILYSDVVDKVRVNKNSMRIKITNKTFQITNKYKTNQFVFSIQIHY